MSEGQDENNSSNGTGFNLHEEDQLKKFKPERVDLDRLVEGKGKDKLLVTVGLEELGTCKQNNIMFKVWLGFPEIYLVCLMEQVPTCMKASRIGVFIIFVETFGALSAHKCI